MFRIKHVASGAYLIIKNDSIGLTYNPIKKHSLFRIVLKDRSSNETSYNDIVKIQSEFNPNLFLSAKKNIAFIFDKNSKENN